MPSLNVRHVPVYVIATGMGFGGLMPLWDPPAAIRTFGLPERIAVSPSAQSCFTLYAARATTLGMAIGIFYWREQFKEVDLIMSLLGYGAAVDSYVCWREGVSGKAVFRAAAGILFGGWGLLGLTSKTA